MLLIKTVIISCIVFVMAGCTAQTTNFPHEYKMINIRIVSIVDQSTIEKLADFVIDNVEQGVVKIEIYTDVMHFEQATDIEKYFKNQLGVTNIHVITDEGMESINVHVYTYSNHCEPQRLNDFNWYRSTRVEIDMHQKTAVCATNRNDAINKLK